MTNQTGAIEPTIGRVMWFRQWMSDGTHADKPLAATVADVLGSNRVNLTVHRHNGSTLDRTGIDVVQHGTIGRPNHDFVEWMPYQVGQAKQSQDLATKLQEQLVGLSEQVANHFTQFGNFREASGLSVKDERQKWVDAVQSMDGIWARKQTECMQRLVRVEGVLVEYTDNLNKKFADLGRNDGNLLGRLEIVEKAQADLREQLGKHMGLLDDHLKQIGDLASIVTSQQDLVEKQGEGLAAANTAIANLSAASKAHSEAIKAINEPKSLNNPPAQASQASQAMVPDKGPGAGG